jgi:hypothetical protein
MNESLHHLRDLVPVGIINGGAFAVVTLTDVEALFKVILLGVTIIYTCVKTYHALKGKKNE